MCGQCKGGKCHEPPTALEPWLLECFSCGGRGCGVCGDRGRIRIDTCPCRAVPAPLWTVFDMVEDADQGHWPVAGGTLDQAADFVAARRIIHRDEAICRNRD